MSGHATRKPAVAGQFYPHDAERLRQAVEQYMTASGVEPAPEQVVAIVAPHAGYIYSGATAGFAYARVKGKKPKRVVLLGVSHRHHIGTASIYAEGAFDSPLGAFPVDEAFADALEREIGSEPEDAHLIEHGLEVQLPFLAVAVGIVPIVPVLFGGASADWHAKAGEAIAGMVEEDDLVVASTDLSHYLNEEEANEIDRHSLDVIMTRNWRDVGAGVLSRECSMCGTSAVVATMAFAKARHAEDWNLLDHRTSAEASGDYDRVVGYAALSMERAA